MNSNPGGKRRRLRRSFSSPQDPDRGDERLDTPPSEERPAPPPEASVSLCQRCRLPVLCEAYVFSLDGPQTRHELVLCKPCSQSLKDWLKTTGPRDDAPMRRHRKPSTNVVAAPVPRHRSTFSRTLDGAFVWSRGNLILYTICALLLGFGLCSFLVFFFVHAGVLSLPTR